MGGVSSRQNLEEKIESIALQDRKPNLAKFSSLDKPRPKERKLTSSFLESRLVSGLRAEYADSEKLHKCIHIRRRTTASTYLYHYRKSPKNLLIVS